MTFATTTNVLTVGGGVVSQASSTVVGKLTLTDGLLSQASSTVVGDFTITGSCVGCVSSSLTTTLTAYEAITAGDAVAVSDGTYVATGYQTDADDGRSLAYGNGSTQAFVGEVLYIPTGGVTVVGLQASLKKIASPVDNVQVSIWSDNAGLPGTLVVATSTFPGASLSTSFGTTTFSLTPTALAANTKYWAMFSRSGALDGTNYYAIGSDLAASSSASFFWNGTTWSDITTGYPYLILQSAPTAGQAFKALTVASSIRL